MRCGGPPGKPGFLRSKKCAPILKILMMGYRDAKGLCPVHLVSFMQPAFLRKTLNRHKNPRLAAGRMRSLTAV
jgi:hypothetical protein